MKMRHFLLVEPFRKSDVSIFPDTPLGLAQATALFQQFQADGKAVKFVTQAGTVNDLRRTLEDLRLEHLPHCGLCDRQIKAGHLCSSCKLVASRM